MYGEGELPFANHFVRGRHGQPWMVNHVGSAGTLVEIGSKHREQEIAKGICIGLAIQIFLHHNGLERPWLERLDVT